MVPEKNKKRNIYFSFIGLKSMIHTSIHAFHAFLFINTRVGMKDSRVSWFLSRFSEFSLHSNFDHIGGLGRQNGHGTSGNSGRYSDSQKTQLRFSTTPFSVFLFGSFVASNANGRKGHLPLKAGHDSIVKGFGSFVTSHT